MNRQPQAGNDRLHVRAVLGQPHGDDRRLLMPFIGEARIASRPDLLPVLHNENLDTHPGTLRPLIRLEELVPAVCPRTPDPLRYARRAGRFPHRHVSAGSFTCSRCLGGVSPPPMPRQQQNTT
jgi:hypothetical protein